MTKTRTELATRALGILNLLQAGQAPHPEDLTAVAGIVDPLAAQLGLDNVIYVDDTDGIDDAVFLPLAARLALEIAPDFGLPAVDDATKARAEAPLRRLAARPPSYRPLTMTSF
ncbi:hypothetical protein [Microvirga sesbaniae]|uniref:hypothetical protein n=1 Tax=Microvirga sesbaniae TaxID=681392 RepID=UPI0021C60D95|nr:hypothetical protein [Microvirga sp. HBU67692]